MMCHIALIYQNVKIPFIFEEAQALNMDITLVHSPNVEVPQSLPAVVQTVSLDIYKDEKIAINKLLELHKKTPFDGILTLFDPAVVFTARAAKALGLPGISEDVALAARDKSLMRTRFKERGLNYPNFTVIRTSKDLELLKKMKFPLVVKPISGFASQGVIRVDNAEQLRHAIAEVEVINQETLNSVSRCGEQVFTGVIVEEFIDGPEYVVESFSHGGKVYVLSIGYKGNCKGPHFEEGIYLAPAPLSGEINNAIIEQVRGAILALGITEGPTHTELRLRDGVSPFILEIGARFGGSGVSHFIVKYSTGINFARLALESAVGQLKCLNIPESPSPIATAGNYIIPIGGDGEVVDIEGLEDVRELTETKRIIQFLFPGDFVHPYPRWSGYPGFILTQHNSYQEGEKFYGLLDQKIKVRYLEQAKILDPEDQGANDTLKELNA